MDQALTKILQKASENPEYQAIANYLMSRRAMPEMQIGGTQHYGSFSTPSLFSGNSVPDRGLLKLNNFAQSADPALIAPTVTHETTHAAERQLIKQYYEIKGKPQKTDLEKRFLDNFQKIVGSSEPEITKWINKVAPGFNDSYRTRSNEALAFGVENAAFKNVPSDYAAPQHVDPTIATQFQLLLDQAQNVQNQQPQSQGR
jgi:hypothetical protein